MVTILLSVLSVLVVAAWLSTRRRMSADLDDEDVRRIEEVGWIEADEPLDLDGARDEEERFWSEDWEDPEPW